MKFATSVVGRHIDKKSKEKIITNLRKMFASGEIKGLIRSQKLQMCQVFLTSQGNRVGGYIPGKNSHTVGHFTLLTLIILFSNLFIIGISLQVTFYPIYFE